nr:NADH dehydrogenase subunit 3 [Hydroides norvegica]
MLSPFLVPLLFLVLGEALKMKEWPKTKVDSNQRSAYECGFSPFQSARRPFSIYFFLVGILFVIFDVELVLVMPFPFFGWLGGLSGLGVGLFLLILVFGLYHEWREGSLSWPSGEGSALVV